MLFWILTINFLKRLTLQFTSDSLIKSSSKYVKQKIKPFDNYFLRLESLTVHTIEHDRNRYTNQHERIDEGI